MSNENIDKPFASSADQNKHDILPVLTEELAAGDSVLELGSGTGQHICFFARHLPQFSWQPSELADKLVGIGMWLAESGCSNIKPPVELDVCKQPWPTIQATACYTANTFHIVSERAVECVFSGCSEVLDSGGKLIVYGPFKFAGKFTADSNRAFDQMLSRSNPESGVRDMDKLNEIAISSKFKPARIVNMPVNNFIALWEKC